MDVHNVPEVGVNLEIQVRASVIGIFRSLSESEFADEALPALRSVFANDDPFGQPVRADIEARALLFPVTFELDAGLLSEVTTYASSHGDEGLFLSVLERPVEQAQDRPYHWFIPIGATDRYRHLGYPFVLENVIYSPSGKWGLMVSHERHAIAAGALSFIRAISQGMPDPLDSQVDAFIREWRDNRRRHGADASWLPWLLANVYGEHRARQLLRDESGWLAHS